MARVYVDSCIVIYAAEKSPAHGAAARRMLLEGLRVHTVCISGLVRLECRVQPMRLGNASLLAKFDAVLQKFHALPLDVGVCDLATELRAAHGLKTPDSLHLACAITHGCDELWTNDDRLLKLAGRIKIRCV